MTQTDLTPVAVITALASTVFSAAVAAVVGPYVVIAVGAIGGTAVALMQRDDELSRTKAFLFFIGATSMAVLLTVPLAMLAAWQFTGLQDSWLFAPFAFGLGYLGDKWPGVLTWTGGKINAFIDILIQLRGGPRP